MTTETGAAISAAVLKDAMLAAGRCINRQRDTLSELDAAAGDGDLGATLGSGFVQVEASLAELSADADVGGMIKAAGMTLARKAPSTFGALLGGAFMRVGAEFQDLQVLSGEDVARLMASLLAAVSERGGAVPGQRTVVDALDGGAQAANGAVARGAGAAETLLAAARGAEAAAELTAEMKPEFGRAAWVAERAYGHRDAGAVAWAMYLSALADAVAAGMTSGEAGNRRAVGGHANHEER